MNKDIIEALYQLATDYDEDNYTKNKTKINEKWSF